MLTLNDGRSELWQWDTGRTLAVDAECSQVHFSNKVFGRSIDVDVVDGVAIIPDVLLQTDKDLFAWAFVGTPENGYTKISKVFKVNRRNKPSDYVFTPPEQTTLGEILERLDDLESIQNPDAIKNAVEDYLEQNPVEAPVQSVNGKIGEVELTSEDVGAISQDDLQEATNNALAQAKESGEFDGEPGKDGAPGMDGQDYVLTEEDKAEIAELAAELVEIPEGSGGGIAVTGAIVGQTVKIAAVDEEGVPTAWEPVDMPSGGSEEWELIDMADLSGLGYQIISADVSAYKKVNVFFNQICSDSDRGSILLKVNNNDCEYTDCKKTKTNAVAWISCEGHITVKKAAKVNNNYRTAVSVSTIIPKTDDESWDFCGDTLSTITLMMNASEYKPVGGTIELYGVRK